VLIELVWFGSLVDGSEGSSILAVREEAVLHCFHLLSSIYRINKNFQISEQKFEFSEKKLYEKICLKTFFIDDFIPPQNQLI